MGRVVPKTSALRRTLAQQRIEPACLLRKCLWTVQLQEHQVYMMQMRFHVGIERGVSHHASLDVIEHVYDLRFDHDALAALTHSTARGFEGVSQSTGMR